MRVSRRHFCFVVEMSSAEPPPLPKSRRWALWLVAVALAIVIILQLMILATRAGSNDPGLCASPHVSQSGLHELTLSTPRAE